MFGVWHWQVPTTLAEGIGNAMQFCICRRFEAANGDPIGQGGGRASEDGRRDITLNQLTAEFFRYRVSADRPTRSTSCAHFLNVWQVEEVPLWRAFQGKKGEMPRVTGKLRSLPLHGCSMKRCAEPVSVAAAGSKWPTCPTLKAMESIEQGLSAAQRWEIKNTVKLQETTEHVLEGLSSDGFCRYVTHLGGNWRSLHLFEMILCSLTILARATSLSKSTVMCTVLPTKELELLQLAVPLVVLVSCCVWLLPIWKPHAS